MSDYAVLYQVTLSERHVPTGRTTHYGNGGLLPPPHSLQIAQHPGDTGLYLFYLDETGAEQTDTHHDDIAAAMAQAEWEFGVQASEWQKPGERSSRA